MQENIFDLQNEITNLIVKHGLADGEFAIIYRDKKIMMIDLKQASVQEAVEKKKENILQETDEMIKQYRKLKKGGQEKYE